MQSKSFPGLVKKKKKKELDKAEGCAVGGWINNRRHLLYLTTVCDKTQNKFDNTVSKKTWLCGLNVRWTEDYSRTTTEILYSNVTFIATNVPTNVPRFISFYLKYLKYIWYSGFK